MSGPTTTDQTVAGQSSVQDDVELIPVEREELNAWRRGFTPQAEIWNGRMAMLGLTAGLLMVVLINVIRSLPSA
ncbi:high light inducible protein [Synechococcus sp. RSCCF101]|uniref:high light inducible protein n=1 Tax=Synechococcus sp. RSCCF101 TaxID=2511069 RepID=UPI001CDA1181|nr:high light inducible protein [Synechococcus sp. RSCCF101]